MLYEINAYNSRIKGNNAETRRYNRCIIRKRGINGSKDEFSRGANSILIHSTTKLRINATTKNLISIYYSPEAFNNITTRSK